MPYCRSDLDVATLHGDDLTGKVQSDTDALNIVYFFFPVKAFEDHALSALSYPFAAVGYVDFYIELPALNGNLNVTTCRVNTICGFLTSTFSKRYSIGVKMIGSPARVAVSSEKLMDSVPSV